MGQPRDDARARGCARRLVLDSGAAPQDPRRLEQLADLLGLLAVAVRVESDAFSASPSTPIGVGLPRPKERRRHREVLVDAREIVGCASIVAALRLRRLERRLAVGDARRVAREQVARSRARRSRRAVPCAAPSAASWAAGRTDSPTRRRSAPAASAGRSRAGRSALHTEVSKKTPGMPGEACGQVRHVGDAGVRDDQLHASARARRARAGAAAIGGRPRPPWMRIGTLALGRQLRTRARAARR